eukprot:TRINITY_DN3316_c0_g1_i2.p1 TRINITY_DN3316_c0_g1~~TRINITY_DN3316_c0_g1_i2.p1  ORF type:complete len:137 (+),score=4.01 TRINITY_DN3316_c0_g1_i2:65-475(+)
MALASSIATTTALFCCVTSNPAHIGFQNFPSHRVRVSASRQCYPTSTLHRTFASLLLHVISIPVLESLQFLAVMFSVFTKRTRFQVLQTFDLGFIVEEVTGEPKRGKDSITLTAMRGQGIVKREREFLRRLCRRVR